MELQSFQVGSVLGRGFGIWLKNFIPFTLLAVLLNLPLYIYTYVVFSDFEATSLLRMAEQLQTYSIITILGQALLGMLLTGALVYGTFEQLRGRHAGIGKCVGVGLSRLLPVLGVALLLGLIIGAPAVLLAFANPGLIILWVIPAAILYCMFWVAIPVAVVERPGVSGALSRSKELTSNYKGQIFLLLLVVGIINFAVSKIAESVVDIGPGDFDKLLTLFMVSLVVSTIVSTLSSVVNAVGYHDLRATKEGVDVEELARVFD